MLTFSNPMLTPKILFSLLGIITASFSCYGRDHSTSAFYQEEATSNRIKILVEQTWKEEINQETFDHLFRIQSYVKKSIQQLSPMTQAQLKVTLRSSFRAKNKAKNCLSCDKYENDFNDYLMTLFEFCSSSSLSPQTARQRSSSVLMGPSEQAYQPPSSQKRTVKSVLEKLLALPPQPPVKKVSIKKGIFTFIDPQSDKQELKVYKSVRLKHSFDEGDDCQLLEYPKLETAILFIKTASCKTYVAYDVSTSLTAIKLRLLQHYGKTFLPDLEGEKVKFQPTDTIIDLGGGEQYPLAKFQFSSDY